jgi:hypothetical protein
MDISELCRRAAEFGDRLDAVKQTTEAPPWGWYPFRMLPGLVNAMAAVIPDDHRWLLETAPAGRVADIGGADGDLSFFFESLGWQMDLYEGGATRIVDLRQTPALLLKDALGSNVAVHGVDLDHDFELAGEYELAFFLGVLYHLRNPMLALECVARSARYCIISTKVARYVPQRRWPLSRLGLRWRAEMRDVPVAYLYDAFEVNAADSSNYWVFSPAALRRTVTRSGWKVLSEHLVGNPNSEPNSRAEGRMWMLLESQLVDAPGTDPMELDERRMAYS